MTPFIPQPRTLRLDVHRRMRDTAALAAPPPRRRPAGAALVLRPIYGIEGIFVKHGSRRRAISGSTLLLRGGLNSSATLRAASLATSDPPAPTRSSLKHQVRP